MTNSTLQTQAHAHPNRVSFGALRRGPGSGPTGDERGFAMIVVLLVLLITGSLIGASIVVGSNHMLVNRYHQRSDVLDRVAESGGELARAYLNAYPNLYPDSGYVTLQDGVAPSDGQGGTIEGVKRWAYAGPAGITSGQYGVFGMVVSVARDEGGGVSIRRQLVFEESFARFAYFTDFEPSYISFGGGDAIWGPVHTNDYLKIYPSGATFHDEARTGKTVQGAAYGTFKKGYEEYVSTIPMPETADLVKLRTQAQAGGTHIVGDSNGSDGSATTRIEFVAIDLNGDGDETDDNEGFLRVYQSSDSRWVSGDVPSGWSDPMSDSENCGHYHADGTFVAAADHPSSGTDDWGDALSGVGRRCYLGGADSIFGGFQADDGTGEWLQWGGGVSSLVAGRDDANYLFPISRELNPDFKGVVFVDGKVVISGKLRGRVTIAATDDIIIGDDIVYATDPGLGTCEDMLGIFSGDDVVVANNTLNAPIDPGPGGGPRTYDDTKDEFIQGVVLALDIFTVEDYADGSTTDERCEGSVWGRGCLYLTGGIIQRTRGAVGTIWSWGGTGYLKRYAYDQCAATKPPPYFPTTGHFTRGPSFQVDPVGFTPEAFFDRFQAY